MSRGVVTLNRQVFERWRTRGQDAMRRPLTLLQLATLGAFWLREMLGTKGGLGFVAPAHERSQFVGSLAVLNSLDRLTPEEEGEPLIAADVRHMLAHVERDRLVLVRRLLAEQEPGEFARAIEAAECEIARATASYRKAQQAMHIDALLQEHTTNQADNLASIAAAGLPLSIDHRSAQA